MASVQSSERASGHAAAANDASGTRRTLMELLKRSGECDVATLARNLAISGVAVRQHLSALERERLISSRTVRRPVGRPARLYRLTEEAEGAFPQANDRVALDLLARMEELMGPEALERLMRSRLGDLLDQYRERLAGAETWAEKLRVLVGIRDAEGYLCNLVPASSPTEDGRMYLVEHHCPLAELARQHPQLCGFELELFRLVLGDPQIDRIEHIQSGGRTCTYEVRAKPDSD